MGRAYAFSDIHGNYNLFKQIQNYIKDTDHVVCLGDCCDRGPDGIRIIQEILKDSRFTYVMGNHEKMLLDAIEAGRRNGVFSMNNFDKNDIEILNYNGQLATLQEYQKLSEEEQYNFYKLLYSQETYFVKYRTIEGKELWLCHAGVDPIQHINSGVNEKLVLWDRKHIKRTKWHNELQNVYIIHGHTPVQALYYYNKNIDNETHNEIVRYCEGHKIDIDLCTPSSKRVALLDLNTLEAIYFEENENNE